MNKRKQLLLTCSITILLIILAFCFLSRMSQEKKYAIYLLNRDLPAGSRITQEMLESRMIPESSDLPGTCRSLEELVGKFLIFDRGCGSVLSEQDLSASQNGVVYPLTDWQNVLYTIALDAKDANGWWLAKGNLVSVLIYGTDGEKDSVYGNPDSGEEKGNDPPVQVMESVKIVRILDDTGAEAERDEDSPGMVCLELTREQAQTLFAAENSKKIKLIAGNLQQQKEGQNALQ